MRKESCEAEPEKGIPRSQCSELEKGIYLGYGCPSASISVKVAARAYLYAPFVFAPVPCLVSRGVSWLKIQQVQQALLCILVTS